MKRLLALAVAGLLLMASTPVWAVFFVSNYSEWRQLSSTSQRLYVAGLFEGIGGIGFDANGAALGQGLTACALQLKLTDAMMADAVSSYYQNRTDTWGVPARLIFWEAIVRGVCLRHVNEERVRRDLKVWVKE